MAPSVGTLRVGRYFGVLVVLLGLLYLVVYFPGNRHTPKLGIDLVGGKRVIFTALSPKGSPPPTSSQMTQARQIIEDRVNGQGVTGATVQVQGGDQLVVLLPGANNADVKRLGEAAVLNFRGVVAPAQVVTCSDTATGAGGTTAPKAATASASASGAAPNDAAARPLAAPTSATGPAGTSGSSAPGSAGGSGATTSGAAPGSASGSASTPAPSPTATQATRCSDDPIAQLYKSDPGLRKVMPNAESCPSPALPDGATCRAYDKLTAARQQALTAALQNYRCSAAEVEPDLASQYYIACDTSGSTSVAYLLGHIVVRGQSISSADAVAPSQSGTGGNAEWTVALNLGGSGADNWNAWTSKFHTTQTNVSAVQTSATAPCMAGGALPCSDFVAFTLGGRVISAPITNAVLDRQTSISGGFTPETSMALAQELSYGKLPLTFRPDSNEDVSATLGTTQLKAAFLAGGIGLLLVVIYSLLYYRGLGLVTIASLIVSAGLTYAMLVILGNQIGFTLDLAGIAGFIVALGITADSFVVFFERIKDEVHEGRSMRVAVPRAWVRARRTILSADTVSFLAAAILYFFASADVKGFAFTLGLSTILDLIVVFLFTHPIVSLLSRSRAFGSPRFTGLNSVRVGGIVDPVEPEARRRPARTAAARRASARPDGEQASSGSSVSTRKRSSVAVADESDEFETNSAVRDDVADPTDVDVAHSTDTDVEDDTIAGTDDVGASDSVDEDEDAQDVDAVESDAVESDAAARARRRRGSTPRQQASGGGSAAERAAARRARQRAGTNESTTDETGSDDGRES